MAKHLETENREKEIYMNIWEYFRYLRLKNSLSQEYIADYLDIDRKQYINIENWKRRTTIREIDDLLKLYQLNTLDLLYFNNYVLNY